MASVVDRAMLRPRVQARPAGQECMFAHPSEAEFASLLTFYGISWQYEPTTFPLEWDAQGRVSLAFSPDFYLPEYDLYIELATRQPAQMTRKHRKVRRLQELYPEVHIKLVNRRAFADLLVKFGMQERAGQLIGCVGGAGGRA
ncbi:MAG: hypothetical protein ACUVX9_13035 [Anaerolineae bacterium]